MQPHLLLTLVALAAGAFAPAQESALTWNLAGNHASRSSKLGTTNAIALKLYTNNVQRMVIGYNTGNVGIGTNNPTERLIVNSPSGTNAFRVQVNGNTKLLVHSNGGIAIGANAVPSKNGLYITGNVGIGVAIPAYKLQVMGDAFIQNDLTITNGALSVNKNAGAYGVYATSPQNGIWGHSTSSYGKGVYGTGTNIGVYGSGNTGVWGAGNISGVYGSGNEYGVYGENKLQGYGAGVYGFSSNSGVLGTGWVGVQGEGEGYGIYGHSNAYNGVSGIGFVGVSGYSEEDGEGVTGTSAHGVGVFGSVEEPTSSSYAGMFIGDVLAIGNYQGSDRILKQGITDISNALDIIEKLQPKYYQYRQDGKYKLLNLPAGKHYGLIAQDVEEVLPHLVKATSFATRMLHRYPKLSADGKQMKRDTSTTFEPIAFKTLNYIELIPIVIKGMQEQAAENHALKEEVEDLKKRLKKLESLLTDNGNTITSTSSYLEQNSPNPVTSTTTIRYHVPESPASAKLIITNAKGQVAKSVAIATKGAGQVTLDATLLASGTYNYTLWVDGKQVDAKRFIIAR